MNGVTGRMGYRQHLLRSILAIRDDGGIALPDGTRLQVEPVLLGRNADKLARLADQHRSRTGRPTSTPCWPRTRHRSTSTPRSPASARRRSSRPRPPASTSTPRSRSPRRVAEGQELVDAAERHGIINGVVHDKLYLPGLMKLKRLVDSGFFGRILSVRGEFGYWVFEGDYLPAQRPSWNYRAQDGGGMVLDMFCHWNYVLENLFGAVEAVTAKAVTHIPERWDENGERYDATADDAAYAIFELAGGIIAQVNSSWAVRVERKELVEFQVDGTHGSAVAGSLQLPHPAARVDADAGVEPRPADHRGLPRPVARDPRQPGLRQRLPRAVGAVPPRRARRVGPTATTSPPASAASSSSTPACCPRAEGRRVDASMTVRLRRHPGRRRRVADRLAPASRASGRTTPSRYAERVAFAAAHVVADPRGENVPGAPAVVDWDVHPRLPPRAVPLRLRRRGGDGHRAAQHGAGLAGRAGAGAPQRRAGPRARRPHRLRRRHRPRRAWSPASTRCERRTPSRSPSSSRPARR